jgi:Na+-translocating ferredoxin:NAD+ oxidoreductase RnfG subunit
MNLPLRPVFGASLLAATLVLNSLADTPLPGQIDFGPLPAPASGGEFVEVNLGSNMLFLASHLVDKQDADTAKLLSSVKLVKVNVVGVDDSNRDALEKCITKTREKLAAQGWERVVSLQDHGDDVGVYLKTDPKEGIQGATALILDGKKEAVFVNIVGSIQPEQLAALGQQLHIDPLQLLGQKKADKLQKKPTPSPATAEKK